MSKTFPETQKAWMVTRKGTPRESLKQVDDAPVLKPVAGEVLVKVYAAALNPIGYKAMMVPDVPILNKRPHAAEYDFSGVVVDANGTKFNDGDEVYGLLRPFVSKRQGSLSEYIVVNTDWLMLRPPIVPALDAAGLGLAGITAVGAALHLGKVEADQTVFIHGGTTAVGLFCVQIAKAKGAKVVVTASPKNFDKVKALGADEVVDYHQSPPQIYFSDHPPSPPFNVVIDCIAKESALYLQSEKYLAPSGVFVSVGFPPPVLTQIPWALVDFFKFHIQPSWLGGVRRKYLAYHLGSTGWASTLEDLNGFLASGQVKPITDSVYAFGDALEAFDRIFSERAVGKVIVKAPSTP